MSPSEFWSLHPVEFWWMFEARRKVKMYGRLDEDEVASLYEKAYGTANPNDE